MENGDKRIFFKVNLVWINDGIALRNIIISALYVRVQKIIGAINKAHMEM